MAEGGPPYNLFTLDHLDHLGLPVWQEIANYFDGHQTNFNLLAYYLGFTDLDVVHAIWNRGFIGSTNSATHKLLDEYRRKGGTILSLYQAFLIMDHSAINILKNWYPEIHRAYMNSLQRNVPPMGYTSGQERSCNCPSCNRGQFEYQTEPQNPTSNPPRPNRYSRQTSTHSLQQRPQSSVANKSISRSSSVPSNGYQEPNYGPISDYQAQTNGATRGGQGRMVCECDKCRLRSDPNETRLMTYYLSDIADECLHSQEARESSKNENGQSDRVPNDTFESSGERPKICANSKNGVHHIGTRSGSCNVCQMVQHRHSWHSNESDRRSLIESPSLSDSNLNGSVGPKEVAENPINHLYSVQTIAHGNDFNQYNNITNSRSDNFSRTQSNSPPGGHSASGIQNISNQTVKRNLNISNQSTRVYSPTHNESANRIPEVNTTSMQRNQTPSNHSMNGSASAEMHYGNGNANPNANAYNRQQRQTRIRAEEQRDNRPIVLITYSNHNAVHLGEIKRLIKLLQEANVRVKIDMDPGCFDDLRLNRNEWLDRMVDTANHVLICISPTYSVDVGDVHDVNDPDPRVTQLNAKYIFDRLRTEYINNQSQNRRMIPVLFPSSGAVHPTHVPAIMQPTLVYSFPNQVRDIVARIVGGDQMALPYA